MSENQPEQTTPSAEQQPVQQPAPVSPEQPAPDPAQVPAPAPAEQVPPAQPAPAGDPDETTDAGNGAGDQPTPAEQDAVVDVTEPAPPENPHGGDEGEGSPGFGVTGKFVHDEPPADDAGTDQ